MTINLDTLLELLLAISLSAAAGFRVFVPLLVLSAAAVFGHIDLPSNLDWIENPQALALFGAASMLEVIGYSIPWFDHLLDLLATPAAIIAGTVVAASFAPEMDPLVQWTLALVAGGGAAGLTKTLMNLLRGGSTAATGGLANPIFAAFELVIAIGLSTLAIATPVVAGAIVISIFGFAFYKINQLIRRFQRQDVPTEP
ncbi:DUF4126 domain-containing protein [filamentous cyanobacterium LEGE 11480]|uniref:DUF4126 domain-containing protein n=1 Tax=Romeriopsis navalis LEGE 11480 TaxID=2777977 RepID=A0A928Z3X1_9CYAN|nr:DUF4126 domain-containing protein [Romeriopsis navalis]MBE9029720.1 DUF4126 domain-containing protein [Romeriopsis navalis LEGE 11480]